MEIINSSHQKIFSQRIHTCYIKLILCYEYFIVPTEKLSIYAYEENERFAFVSHNVEHI